MLPVTNSATTVAPGRPQMMASIVQIQLVARRSALPVVRCASSPSSVTMRRPAGRGTPRPLTPRSAAGLSAVSPVGVSASRRGVLLVAGLLVGTWWRARALLLASLILGSLVGASLFFPAAAGAYSRAFTSMT